MDFDTVSNCSSLSLHSEEIRSNVSTLSGLSAYKDEFTELCELVNPAKYTNDNRCSTPKQDPKQRKENVYIPHYLENSQQVQEKFKSDLYLLEKNIELKYRDKIDKLLKTNHRLQSELIRCNDQISRLLKNYSKQNESSVLDKSFIQLEQKYHDLTLRYSELQQDCFQSKNENEEYETANRDLRTELSELKIDIEIKNESIKELKNKVCQQYVEVESLLRTNFKFSQTINELTSELAYLKKTKDWYKERLNLCQNEKQVLSDEILKCKADVFSERDENELLKVELSKWKAKCDVIELQALKDKDELNRQLDSLKMTNYFKTDHPKEKSSEIEEHESYIKKFYETNIQDLTHEIEKIKEYVQEQDNMIQRITKENAELTARCIVLQKSIHHNELTIEELEDIRKQLRSELNEMKHELKEKSDELIIRENQILNLQAEIKVRKDEQDLVDQTAKTINGQFTDIKSKYKELKDELSTKNKQILQIENEKQKLFMNNNWNICELEKLKEKDIVIGKLRNELNENNETMNEYIRTIENLKNEMNKNQENNYKLLDEKQTTIDKEHLEIQKYENVLTQYKSMVSNYEQQLMELRTLLNESNVKIADLKDNIKILNEEINRKDSNLNEMKNKLEMDLKYHNEDAKIFSNDLKNSSNRNSATDVASTVMNVSCSQINKKILEKSLWDNPNSQTSDRQNITKSLTPLPPNIKRKVSTKIKNLEERINKLNEICHKSSTALNNIFNFLKDDQQKEQIQKLNVLLQVKELELKEKQKKYEANNRTLLRKVKEHMKGRNTAEKHNLYLQEMYNTLSEENNTLKLDVKSKEYEIENMKIMLDKFTNVNETLKISVSKFTEQATNGKTCDKCILSNEKIESLEKGIKELHNKLLTCENMLTAKEDVIVNLQKEIQHLLQTNVSLSACNKKLTDEVENSLCDKQSLCMTIETLQNEIKSEKSRTDEMNVILKQEKDQISEVTLENNHLKNTLDEVNTRIEYLSNEIKILNSRLQTKSEELKQMENNKSKMESNWLEKQKDFQTVINTMKRYMHEMHSEITSINNEKHFLQRLCADLKVALKSHANQNKMLQHQLNVVSEDKEFNSLPNMLPNIPCDIKYDDDYINQLLQQNKVPLQTKPITEMKSCLDTLKKEVSTLQEQIARKNIQY